MFNDSAGIEGIYKILMTNLNKKKKELVFIKK